MIHRTQKDIIATYAYENKDNLDYWDFRRIKAFGGKSRTLKELMLEKHEDMDTYDVAFDGCVTVCDYYDSPLPKEGEDDYYYYRFCDHIMSSVNVVNEGNSKLNTVCDYEEYIKRNWNKLKAFTKENWVRDYKDNDRFVGEWIDEIHGYLAGYTSESMYKAYVECMEKPDNEPNKEYAEFINKEILSKINTLGISNAFAAEVGNDYSDKALNSVLETVIGRKKMPHDNKIYNQEILMEFAGYSKGEDEYSLRNDMTGDIVHFKNDDEIYDYLVIGLSNGEGDINLYSYDKKPDMFLERVEHFEFDRISYEVVKVYPPQGNKTAAIMANPKFDGKIGKCTTLQTYDDTEQALGAMHEFEVQLERNKVYNDIMKVANAIDENIHACGTSDFHYDMQKAIDDTVDTYGRDKTLTTAAILVLDRKFDGRISQVNREWASEYLNSKNDDNINHIKDDVHCGALHSILLDGFVSRIRKNDSKAQQIEQDIDYEEEQSRKV